MAMTSLCSFYAILIDMPNFSVSSATKLATAHEDLQRLFKEVVKRTNCSIICGHRNQAEQNQAFTIGTSKLAWPNSKHNSVPSMAVDAMPYPLSWTDRPSIDALAAVVKEVAKELGIAVQWGGDFPRFPDLDHWQLP